MLFENLESRRLMSVTLNPISKTLTVLGTNNNDNIVVSQTATHVKVNDNGVLRSFLASNVNQISVAAYDGADHVTLQPSVTKPSFIDSGKNTDGENQYFMFGRREVINGGSGKDTIMLQSQSYGQAFGNNDDDTITVFGRENLVDGDAGNDRIILSDGRSATHDLYGGAGNDTIDYSKGTEGIYILVDSAWTYLDADPTASYSVDSLDSLENILGTQDHDFITGTAAANKIWGNGGNDNIKGGAGNDSIYGGQGNDALYGEGNDDYLQGDAGNDFLSGGTGADAMYGNNGNDTFYSKDQVSDFLSGGAGTDTATAANRDAIDILNSIELT